MKELVQIQATLKAPKNQRNTFGKYNYRSCEDILEGLKVPLAETNCSVVINDEIVMVGERYYIKAIVTLYNEDGSSSISSTGWAREANEQKGMAEAQLTGATSSYARKYALNALFAIDDVKDADTDAFTEKAKSASTPTKPKPTGKPSPKPTKPSPKPKPKL